jgi:polar amino acid transport system substrate-binding protein
MVIGHTLTNAFAVIALGLAIGFADSDCKADDKKLSIVADNYPPYYGKGLRNGGVLTEIVAKAFKRAGYEVEINFVPWKRALEGAKAGKHDGLFTLWYRKEREAWFIYSNPISPASEIGFYKRKDSDISFKAFEDLKPYMIGVGRGYATPPGFKEASLKTSLAKDDEENLRKLHKGRIDLALTDKLVAKYIISSRLPDAAPDIAWLPPTLHVETNHFAVSRKVKGFNTIIADFNRGLAAIEADGTLKAIIAKHGF